MSEITLAQNSQLMEDMLLGVWKRGREKSKTIRVEPLRCESGKGFSLVAAGERECMCALGI